MVEVCPTHVKSGRVLDHVSISERSQTSTLHEMGRMALTLALAAAGASTSDSARSLTAFGSFSPGCVPWQAGTAGRTMRPRARREVGTLGLSASSNKDVGGEALLGDPMAAALRGEVGSLSAVVVENSSAVVVEKSSSVIAQVKGTWKIQRQQLLRSSSWITVLAGVLDGMGMVTCPPRSILSLSRACMPRCYPLITLQLYGLQ